MAISVLRVNADDFGLSRRVKPLSREFEEQPGKVRQEFLEDFAS